MEKFEEFILEGKTSYTSGKDTFEVYVVRNTLTGYKRLYSPEDFKIAFGGKL